MRYVCVEACVLSSHSDWTHTAKWRATSICLEIGSLLARGRERGHAGRIEFESLTQILVCGVYFSVCACVRAFVCKFHLAGIT